MSSTASTGKLLAARLEMLAAEISEPGRLWRGRSYVDSGAVLVIELVDGRVHARVQGSSSEPYRVTVARVHHDGPVRRTDLHWSCTCADSAPALACKHVAAIVLTIAARVVDDPALLDRWGEGSSSTAPGTASSTGADHGDDVDRRADQLADQLADLVNGPEPLGEWEPPELPTIEHPAVADPVVDRLLRSALAELVDRET